MTAIQFICVYLIFFIFVALLISIAGVLEYINGGEYRKALYTSVVSVVLTIIVFALILSVF